MATRQPVLPGVVAAPAPVTLAGEKGSPTYGMPILEAHKARMMFGAAKKVVEDIVKAIE